MTLIVGNVVDVGLAGVDGTLRVWAWFRPEEVGLIAPYRREWEITGGEIEAGVDVIPGPAAVEIDCGPNAYTTVDVMVPDAESVTIQDLFEQVYSYTPGVVSEAWEARRGAEAAAESAEESAGVALGAEQGALAAESGAALSAATLSARVEQSGQDILYTSDGKPYFADPAQIQNVPLTVDTSVGTRVMLGNTMVFGDTGMRDIASTAARNGAAIQVLRVQRVTSIVNIELSVYVDPGFPNGGIGIEFPIGFRPTGGTYWTKSYDAQLNLYTLSGAGVQFYGVSAVDRRYARGMYSFITRDAWPTSLPGTPF